MIEDNRKFRLDSENHIIKKQYEENDNYHIESPGNSDKCFVFFSGNGLYYPNTISSFCKTVVEQNRYEWWNVGHSEEIVKQAGKLYM